jgi:predicted TIM-barrel fold metal-dependent hydrolase
MSRWIAIFAAAATALAQTAPVPPVTLEEYSPKSSLVVPGGPLTRAKFPFIDFHSHQNNMMKPEQMDKLVAEMDSLNLRVMVNLSGGYGERFRAGAKNIQSKYPKRFALFCNLDLTKLDDPDYADRAARTLEQDIQAGCVGLKFFKSFGWTTAGAKGRVAVNDPRFEKVFEVCAKYKIPVLIHTADPRQFWDPVDKFNERYLELTELPRRRVSKGPSWQELMDEALAVFRRHKNVPFVQAHMGWLGGDLGKLGKRMDEMPNYHVDIAAVIAELGRQPRFARQFLTKYQDRVLMAKDSWQVNEFTTYFRVLETNDDYFPYHNKRHAFWAMYGIGLPDEVLKKMYYKNALRLLPKVDAALFPK